MLIPHRPLLLLGVLWLGLGVAAAVDTTLIGLWWLAGAGIAALAAIDALLARRLRSALQVERHVPHALPVGGYAKVELRLQRSGANPEGSPGAQGRALRGWISDGHPPEFAATGLPLPFTVAPGRWMQTEYRLHLTARGRYRFSGSTLRLISPLGLWLWQTTVPGDTEVHVYPDFAKVVQYTLLATDHRLSQLGVLRRRRRGEGLEFHQLREYRREDTLRQVDWKASARLGRMISREYQDERDQQIIFLLDCSQRMRARDGELSHFDHTLNALLLLAYVALRQGDAVGLCTFGHEAPRLLKPKKGATTVNTLLNTVFDLEPSAQVPDYLRAAEILSHQLDKRALVVLASNLRDEDDSTLLPALHHLRRRHTVTLASLREPVLETLRDAPVGDFEGALTRAATLDYLEARRRQAAALRHAGVQLLDVTPAQLPLALINHYWERKRAGNL